MDYLIQHGSLIDHRDRNMYTPLHLACCTNSIHITKALLKNGANPNARTVFYSTPLFLAVSNGETKIVKLLLDENVDVNIKSSNGLDFCKISHHSMLLA